MKGLIIMMLIVALCIAVTSINIMKVRAVIYGLTVCVCNSFASWARVALLMCIELMRNRYRVRYCVHQFSYSRHVDWLNKDTYFFKDDYARREKERKREIFIRARLSVRRQNANACVSKLDGCSDSTRRSYRARRVHSPPQGHAANFIA